MAPPPRPPRANRKGQPPAGRRGGTPPPATRSGAPARTSSDRTGSRTPSGRSGAGRPTTGRTASGRPGNAPGRSTTGRPGASAGRTGSGRSSGGASRGSAGAQGAKRDARPRYGDERRDQVGSRGPQARGARSRPAPRDRYDDREMRGPRRWGGLARRGAGRATAASEAWRAAGRDYDKARPPEAREDEAAWQPEEWIDEGELRDEAAEAVGRSRAPRPAPARRPKRGAQDTGQKSRDESGAGEELKGVVPANRVARFEQRLDEAGDAFRRERYEDARRILRPLAEQAPGASSVRELYGLTLYRLGRWAQARRELEAFRTQTGSTEQHPVLADANRALGRYDEVEELWEELRAASPSAELVAEGRIVAAGALADQGRLEEAIALLAAASKPAKRPKLHHLRIAYALADLYERAGDLPRARELFGLVAANDPDFVDIQARLRALR
jgi:thioredoxin-like negative regulator of GroEL